MPLQNSTLSSKLTTLEPRLRSLLPADLYVTAWLDPSQNTLTRVFGHLRTLQNTLQNYVSRQVSDAPPKPGEIRYGWQEGTLMFTDLAGFTPLMEATAKEGRAGARMLLDILNTYFGTMLEIISKSGGDLLEFTGDAVLALFPSNPRHSDTTQAVRAGLRIQRAMHQFEHIETLHGERSLRMRIGIHPGRFLGADVGTPHRMEHVLLGDTVLQAKKTEGAGEVERVCLTETAWERVSDQFRAEPGKPGYKLIIDDFTKEQLGEYDLVLPRRRGSGAVLLDRSIEGLLNEVEKTVELTEPLASYQPASILKLLVESTASREITPDFIHPTVVFVNLIGLAESINDAQTDEEAAIVASFSRVISLINGAVEVRGGIMRKVTYHLTGSDIMICFGVPTAHTNDACRAIDAALALREIIHNLTPPVVGGQSVHVSCRIGISRGPAFAAEVGETRGRREFNILSNTVNTAARLMTYASEGQILMTESVYEKISSDFDCQSLGRVALKGKAAAIPVFAL